jgi:hypothetical protein
MTTTVLARGDTVPSGTLLPAHTPDPDGPDPDGPEPPAGTAGVSDARLSWRLRLLLASYPAGWRSRYGEEFTELLIAEYAERPQSARRTTDVMTAGLRARLAAAGLADHPLDPATAARATRTTSAAAIAVFAAFGVATWSQLAIGAQWVVPDNGAITQALGLMSGALAAFAVLTALGALTLAWTALRMWAHGKGRPLAWPACLIALSAAILIVGGRHFENGWPGTGGHLLLHQVAAACMAVFCCGALRWLAAAGGGPQSLFHVGVIDRAGVAVLALAGGVAALATKRKAAGATRLGR